MAKDWSKIYKKYKGLWVALAPNEETVLGSGKTLREALSEAREKTSEAPIITRVPLTLEPFVGTL